MARAALDWTVADLAAAAGVGAATIIRFESGQSTANKATLAAIERTFRTAGIGFSNGEEPAVHLSLRIATPVTAGEDYVFDCVYQGEKFKAAVNRVFLDEHDRREDPHQTDGKFRLKRLALRMGPFVIRAWATGKRPTDGSIRLVAGDFSAMPALRASRPRIGELPTHDVPWDGSISLHREDIYSDDGR